MAIKVKQEASKQVSASSQAPAAKGGMPVTGTMKLTLTEQVRSNTPSFSHGRHAVLSM